MGKTSEVNIWESVIDGTMKKPKTLYSWPLLLAIVATAIVFSSRQSEAGTTLYICKDRGGSEHFTNVPEADNCVIYRTKRSSLFASVSGRRPSNSSTQYSSHINHFGNRYNVDPNLIKAVIRTESGFDRYAVSRQGAQGLMQLMPGTARELNVSDPFNPSQNIDGGTRYLRSLLDTFNGDLTLTLAAYNAGPTLVKRVRRVPRIPETITYVQRVLAYYQGYRGGDAMDTFYRSNIRVRGIVTVQ